jgi:membrane protease YdiL (CAAX protease family)
MTLGVAMKRLVSDRPVPVFFVLAVLIALVAMAIRATDPPALGKALGQMFERNQMANIVTGVQASIETPVLWNAILFPAAPTIAAFLVIGIAYGRHGLRAWLGRFRPWCAVPWRQGVAVWLLFFAVFVATIGVYFAYAVSVGKTNEIALAIQRLGPGFPALVGGLAMMLLLSSGPLLEEMGWRGFLLPLVLTRMTPLTASIVVGVLWAAWHLPREIAPLMSGTEGIWASFAVKQVNFFGGCICSSIIATFLFFKLGGSVWGGMLVHAFHNEISVNIIRGAEPVVSLLGFPARVLTLFEVVIAGVIIVLAGRNLGADQDYRQAPNPFLARDVHAAPPQRLPDVRR